MNEHQGYGLLLFLVVALISGAVYIRNIKYAFTINNRTFVQVGVMEYKADGDIVYIPVFKKRN